jgi:hypothetical protein
VTVKSRYVLPVIALSVVALAAIFLPARARAAIEAMKAG